MVVGGGGGGGDATEFGRRKEVHGCRSDVRASWCIVDYTPRIVAARDGKGRHVRRCRSGGGGRLLYYL